eukprot:TRINITY_DN3350_c1_g1_i1.p1 TRINITY_DN3350_c1_g1~~TRINITY_DN3350_c1_g1_i1.p1  ORF type:complete len:259 (-),score=61.32 TRINITY_DN3350_c1_g1_i1:20-796(-)
MNYGDLYGFPPLSECNITKSSLVFGSAVDFIVDSVRNYSNRIVFVCTGPLTNIAAAIMKSNFTMDFSTVRGLVFEGGGIYAPERDGTPGNYSDWNTFVDPVATAIVLSSLLNSSTSSSKAVMMGSDITSQTRITPFFREKVHGAVPGSPEGSVLKRGIEIVARWKDSFLYDFVTAAHIIRPRLFHIETLPVEVVVIGPESGRTLLDPYNGSFTQVAIGFSNETTITALSSSLTPPPPPSSLDDLLLTLITQTSDALVT